MIQQQGSHDQKQAKQIKQILTQFKQLYQGILPPDKVQQIFHACLDQSFSKTKTSLTQNQVQSLYDGFKVAAKQHQLFMFNFDTIITTDNTRVVSVDIMEKFMDPLSNIKRDYQLRSFLPYGIFDFDYIDIQTDRTMDTSYKKMYHYQYQVYCDLPWQLKRCLRNTSALALIFFHTINFQWVQAATLYHQILNSDQLFKQKYQMLKLIFDKIYYIKRKVTSQKKIRVLFQQSQQQQINTEKEQIKDYRDQVIDLMHQLQLISIFCGNYQLFSDPYLRSTLYFLGSGKHDKGSQYTQIIQNNQLPQIVKFYFAKRFLSDFHYKSFVSNLSNKIKLYQSCQYMPFVNTPTQLQLMMQYQLQYNREYQKISLIGLIFSAKKNTGPSKKQVFSQLVDTYLQLLNFTDCNQARINFIKFYQMINDFHGTNKQIKIFNKQIVYVSCVSCGVILNFGYQLKSKLQGIRKNLQNTTQFAYENDEYQSNTSNSQVQQQQSNYKVFKYRCHHCKYINTVCYLCLKPILMYCPQTFYNQMIKNPQSQRKNCESLKQIFDNSLTYCPKCQHGGHFSHVLQWQQKHPETCAVFNCSCKCKF